MSSREGRIPKSIAYSNSLGAFNSKRAEPARLTNHVKKVKVPVGALVWWLGKQTTETGSDNAKREVEAPSAFPAPAIPGTTKSSVRGVNDATRNHWFIENDSVEERKCDKPDAQHNLAMKPAIAPPV